MRCVRFWLVVLGVLLGLGGPGRAGCCVFASCALPCPPPAGAAPLLLPPVQPSFHVEQGPTFQAVLIAEDDVERRLEFAHPHWFPYVGGHARRR